MRLLALKGLSARYYEYILNINDSIALKHSTHTFSMVTAPSAIGHIVKETWDSEESDLSLAE